MLVAILLVSGCKEADYYRFLPISGVLKDRVTQQPITDAVIFAQWNLSVSNGFWQGTRDRPFFVAETVSDENGYFEIVIPKDIENNLDRHVVRMANLTPNILIFKVGYERNIWREIKLRSVNTSYDIKWPKIVSIGEVAIEFRDKDNVLLDPFNEQRHTRVQNIRFLKSMIQYAGCFALKIPIFHQRVNDEYNKIETEKNKSNFKSIDYENECKGV